MEEEDKRKRGLSVSYKSIPIGKTEKLSVMITGYYYYFYYYTYVYLGNTSVEMLIDHPRAIVVPTVLFNLKVEK